MPDSPRLDPWGRGQVEDYPRLVEAFGIESFPPLLPGVAKPMRYMARGVIFGHRDYARVIEAMRARGPFGVISGFMPSGRAHLGAKMVMEEIVWHQRMGGDATVAIADMEAHAVRGVSWEKCREWGVSEYILSLIALGLKPKNARVYFQSENRQVQDLAFELAKEANYSEMKAIYGFTGETTLAHMLCPAVQAADILAPQLPGNGGPRLLVVPVGVDQDPHIRLTRDMAARMDPLIVEHHQKKVVVRSRKGRISLKEIIDFLEAVAEKIEKEPPPVEIQQSFSDQRIETFRGSILEQLDAIKKIRFTAHEQHIEFQPRTAGVIEAIVGVYNRYEGGYNFLPPAGLYHRFMSGLTGGKMSSSVPESHIALSEPPKDAEAKVLKARTGGRATEEEQRRLGGEPGKCAVYELMQFHLDDDKALGEMHDLCVGGRRLCGACKKWAAGEMRGIMEEHREKREEARGRLDEFGVKAPRS
ncbi:MAG: tryptophan--tRNA ligase [Euryarchaeota archaeon]|nr:tryptophan--tRNA ligase [Euryarchaeota archaeon]